MKMKDLFLSRKKKWGGWGAKPYEEAGRTLFRWGIIVRIIFFWTLDESGWICRVQMGVERAGWIDPGGTRFGAFADDKNFEKIFVWWRPVDDINCKTIR